jgi:hypothetical protein
MGNKVNGNQKILWRYKTPLMGKELAEANFKIWYPGVYEGLAVTKTSDTMISLAPGSFVINEYNAGVPGASYNRCVKILNQDSLDVTLDTTGNKIFLVARFVWNDTESNGADFLNLAYTDIDENDVVLSKFEYTGDFKISRVDNASKTYGMNHAFDNLVLNLDCYSSN